MERQERGNDLEEGGMEEAAVRGGENRRVRYGEKAREREREADKKERCYEMLKKTNMQLTIYSCASVCFCILLFVCMNA